MKQLHKKTFIALLAPCLVLFFCVFIFVPHEFNQKNVSAVGADLSPKTENSIVVANAAAFDDIFPGVYLTRPEKISANSSENLYYGTISTDNLSEKKDNFNPVFKAMIMQNDNWCELENSKFFWVDVFENTNEDGSSNFGIEGGVFWYLRETAPAALYGVRCIETEHNIDKIFKVLYAGDWTYINVTNNENGKRSISNFFGGNNKTLSLNITYNDGAARPNLSSQATQLPTGVAYGCLDNNAVVTTESMLSNIVVKTVSGNVYNGTIEKLINRFQNNKFELRFMQPLENDIYIIQFVSSVGNHVMGQFIIDNTNMHGGVNLSQFWVVLMVFGGLLTLGAALAYFVPLMLIKFNEARVYKENERVARIKNPEAYVSKEKKSFKEIINKIIYNIKTPVYKRKKEEKEKEEVQSKEKTYTNRFTDMLRERQEKREYMRVNNITSEELERRKAAEDAIAADEMKSFASLRDNDEDEEIATFHAAEDEISTLETGGYVRDGARFAKLDSLTDDEPIIDEDGNDSNGNGF